jgi:hypothetical protein
MRAALHIAGALLFGVFAWVQLNDPDPALWVAIYCVTAGLSAGTLAPRSWPVAAAWAVGCVLAGGAWALLVEGPPMQAGQTGFFDNEVVRESLGLEISGLWTAGMAWSARRKGA